MVVEVRVQVGHGKFGFGKMRKNEGLKEHG
jgi:hypothetical protein